MMDKNTDEITVIQKSARTPMTVMGGHRKSV